MQAILTSVQEPQLPGLLEDIENQTVKFDSLIHIDSVVPEHMAHNMAIKQATSEWIMNLNGDFRLKLDAHEEALRRIASIGDDFAELNFGLFDAFLKRIICCCSVWRTSVFKEYLYGDDIFNDNLTGKATGADGWKRWKLFKEGVTLGTHFSNPTDEQVFGRFYTRGVKSGRRGRQGVFNRYHRDLKRLLDETRDPQYKLAIQAMKIGFRLKEYPGSLNVDFVRGQYKKWKEGKL